MKRGYTSFETDIIAASSHRVQRKRLLTGSTLQEASIVRELQCRIDALDVDDAEKAGLLFELVTQQVQEENFEQAMQSCLICRQLALDTGDTATACRVLVIMGYLYVRVGEYAAAISCFVQCMKYVGVTENADLTGMAWLAIGDIHASMGNEPQAVECYKRSATLFNETGNAIGEVEVLTKLASIPGCRDNLATSLPTLIRALVLYEELQLPEKVAETLIAIGVLYQQHGESDQSLTYLRMARSRAQELKATMMEGTTLIHIAYSQLNTGRIEQALQTVSEAFALNIDSESFIVSVHEVAAAVHEARNDFASAMGHYRWVVKKRSEQRHIQQQELFTDLSARLSFVHTIREREQLDRDVHELRSVLAEKSRENVTLGLQIVQRDNIIQELERQLENLGAPSESPDRISAKVFQVDDISNSWQMLDLLFDERHREFLRNLSTQHPSLTQTELKICSLIRLGLATKDIAQVLFVSVRNIQNHKYRIRKRLNLPADATIASFLTSV